jgi:NaMN:DMB phosphoribosyltransferase
LGGDHGIEREGVSVSPREVTWQQMINFTRGGGGVNMFCRQHGFKLRIVDVGVDYDFESEKLRVKSEELGIEEAFMLRMWELIHEESLKQQK